VSYDKCHMSHHMFKKSHDGYGKIVHRPCSSCISSVQEIEEDSIKFSLSAQTWSRFKLPWLEPYKYDQSGSWWRNLFSLCLFFGRQVEERTDEDDVLESGQTQDQHCSLQFIKRLENHHIT